METKKLWIPILTVALVMALVACVSAAAPMTDNLEVRVNDELAGNNDLSVVAGETVSVKVIFNSLVDTSDVTVEAEIEGNKADVSAITSSFDVEEGYRYSKTLTLKVPYELRDELSDDVSLAVSVKQGNTYKTEQEYTLRAQRPSYNAEILSIVTPNTVDAGANVPVDVVLKNVGYNELDDLYVNAKLTALNGVSRTIYLGDLIALEDDDDDDETTTTSGRINLNIPYDAAPGIYTLEVEVSNDDLGISKVKQIVVENDFPEKIFKAGNDLLIVNPTEELKVYKVVTPESESFITVPKGTSKAIGISPSSDEYTVSVLDMSGEAVDSFTFNAEEDNSVASPVVVLTIILAVIFLVLLIVLIVLIGRKPEKTEDFGESYY